MGAIRRFSAHQNSYCKLLIDTTKLRTGSSANNQYTFGFSSSGFTPMTVDWGDGTQTYFGTIDSVTHTYPATGQYVVTIIGDDFRLIYNNSADAIKLMKVLNYGNAVILSNAFYGCQNLDLSVAEGVPILGTDLKNCFRIASVVNIFSNLHLWDVSNVTDMTNMFYFAHAFNQDISIWNFNKNVILAGFMAGKTAANYSATNYDKLLEKWATVFIGTGRTEPNKNIGMNTIKYSSAGKPYRDALVADGWTITDGGLI